MIQLTDEEILHALEHCEDCVGCAHCIYTHKNVECNNTNDAVKLIHRLQDDLETCSNIEKQEKATNYELRTEIERLTKEKWQVQDDLDNYHAMYQVEVKANAELQKKLDGFKQSIANIGNTKNLRLALMQEGVIILANLLVDKLQPTEKGDKYAVLFKGDCEELIRMALEKVRSEVE